MPDPVGTKGGPDRPEPAIRESPDAVAGSLGVVRALWITRPVRRRLPLAWGR